MAIFFSEVRAPYGARKIPKVGGGAGRVVKIFTSQYADRINRTKRSYDETFFPKIDLFYWQKLKKFGIILKKTNRKS